jgi:uncharacterized membrane protein SpoIIM required for sporulation
MNEVAFVEQREPDWRRLSYLSEKADVSPRNLSPQEFQEFVRLYRRSASDLAAVRTKSNNLQLIDFLNDLVGRAYSTLYRSKRKPFLASIGDAIALSAQTVRRLRWFVLASALTFLGGTAFAYIGVANNPDLYEHFEPAGMKDSIDQWVSGKENETNVSRSTLMTGFYSANNIRVAIIESSISAASFGVGSFYMLWTNGAMTGSLAHRTAKVGRLGHLLTWISPHGASEISGFVIAGAAGYCMGWALILPGRRKRSAALGQAGKDAIVLLCTGIVMIAAAAPVEGYFSYNNHIPDWAKLVFAASAFGAWNLFFIGFGREKELVAASQTLSP